MLFKIGDFSRFCRISIRALRYYDEIGLLRPVFIDQITGYRYYSMEQLSRLNHIIMLKDLGLSLDDIGGLLQNGLPVNHIKQLLQVKKAEIQEHLSHDNRKLRQVDEWLDKINKDGTTPIDTGIQIKAIPAVKVMSKREIGTYEGTLLKLEEELKCVLNCQENLADITITGPLIMLCYDEEYKEKEADVEIALPISGKVTPGDQSIEIKVLPEVRVISAIHQGPYSNIGKVYVRIFEYADEHNLRLILPSRELHFNKQDDVPEEDLLTEIQCPFNEVDSQ